jgi:hypothetical protein
VLYGAGNLAITSTVTAKIEPPRISKVVRKFRPMPIRYCSVLVLIFFFLRCSGPATAVPLADLDYVEVINQTGWVLLIHGDGGGSLSHKQLPAHHLHYPAMTFVAEPARRLAKRCRGKTDSPVCAYLSFYNSGNNKLTVCDCAPGGWAAAIMVQAIDQMQYAVDAGGSERSCRMLQRQWLASN